MLEKLGVQLVKLDLPFRLNHVNCFLAENDDGWLVIDTGLNNDYTKKVWDEQLANKNVTNIFVTHYHPDHYGYAGALQQLTNAKVMMTETDDQAGNITWTDNFIKKTDKDYLLAGVPKETATKMTLNNIEFQEAVTPYPQVKNFFEDGQIVTIAKKQYKVIFTPGHSDGLVCFYNEEEGVLFSTDHILPRITPNISYSFFGDKNPLKTYLSSLEKIEKLKAGYVIPSHGLPFENANKRIAEIKQHHDDRLEETLSYIKQASSAYEVCLKMFPFDLTVHETRFAIGETLSHLIYLKEAGLCTEEEVNGQWIYKRK